jgi:hypothetical protein
VEFEEAVGSGILTPQTRVGSRMAAEFSSIFSRTLFVMILIDNYNYHNLIGRVWIRTLSSGSAPRPKSPASEDQQRAASVRMASVV